MKVVFIIGNGFDLSLGLPTQYKDFYKFYLGLDSNDKPQVKKLKEHLKNDYENENGYQYWSDLEIGIGNYTTNFSNVQELKEAYYDLNDRMQEYIAMIDKKTLPTSIKSQELIRDLSYPAQYLRPQFRNEIRTFLKTWETSSYETFIISFNYTNTIEKILKMEQGNNLKISNTYFGNSNTLYPIIHIHGKIDTDTPLIGVNDKAQIKNEKLRENEEVQECMIKPKLNEMLAYLTDTKAINHIKTANLICIFGHSLGDTDKLWWKLVGERLKTECRVIYFVYNLKEEQRPSELNNIRRKYKNFLLSKTNLTESEKKEAINKIYIALNTNMFKIV